MSSVAAVHVDRDDDGGLEVMASRSASLVDSPALRAALWAEADAGGVLPVLLAELVAALPGTGSATIVSMLGTRLRPLAAVEQDGVVSDQLQEQNRRGPAYTAAACGGVVAADDVFTDPRWSLGSAGQELPSRSVLALGVPSPGAPAVIAVWGTGSELTRPATVEQAYAAMVDLAGAVCVVRARLEVQNLQVALVSNRPIGAGIGVTLVSRRSTYEAAAQLLDQPATTAISDWAMLPKQSCSPARCLTFPPEDLDHGRHNAAEPTAAGLAP